jgi:hypothetical protein
MATSSKYIQLSSSVLMEYIYSDQNQINVPGNEFRIPTSTAPLWKTKNLHSKEDQILNSDSSEVVQDGLPIGTGNVRNRSFAPVEPYKVALLDIDKLVFYNDYDSDLTPTPQLPIVFTGPQSPVYDTIRLHLVQGFNFEDNEALILTIKARKKDGSNFVLCNLVYNREDTWETMNPNPFFFGGRVYNSYLEVRVLSLYNLIYDYWLGVLTGDTVAERITDFNGILRNQQIQTFFSWIDKKETVDQQTYLFLNGTKSVDLPVRDQFETISAYISEASNGDYVEFYATYGGKIIENYILDLNSSGYDFILLHDLVVSEYVYDPSTATYNWIKTDDLQISQTNEYDKPNLYRPIIKNNNAVSYKIDYVVRMYNRNDNTQVWKTASMISTSAAKYGRKLKAINLGSNPVQTKIYNQNVVKDISINRITEPVVNNIRYITSLTDSANISISAESINEVAGATSGTLVTTPTNLQNTGNQNAQIFDNGLAKLLIPNSTSYLKLTMYQKINGQNKRMNLSGLGNLYISFTSNDEEDIDFIEWPNPYNSKVSGEIVFRLSAPEAKRILKLTNREFRVFLENESKDRTFLYAGTFYDVKGYQEAKAKDKITSLEEQVKNLSTQISTLTTLTTTQQKAISTLTIDNNKFAQTVQNLTTINSTTTSKNSKSDLQKQEIINSQNEMIQNLKTQIEQLNEAVKQLTTSLNTSMNALAQSNGFPSPTKNQFKPVIPTKAPMQLKKEIDSKLANIKTTRASNQNPEA